MKDYGEPFKGDGGTGVVFDRNGAIVGAIAPPWKERVITCVNALSGMDPDAVSGPPLVEAVEKFLADYDNGIEFNEGNLRGHRNNMTTALDALKPGGEG